MEQSAADMAAAVPWPLRQSKEVIHKQINIMEELGVFLPGSDIVTLIVSTTHPKRSFQVDPEQSPASNFLRDMTSLDWCRGHGTATAMSSALCSMPWTKFSAPSTLRTLRSGRKSCLLKS